MSSVRKREWLTPKGERRIAYLVDYKDGSGKRRCKQFVRKKDATAFENEAVFEVRRGIHTPDSQSVTVARAAADWLEHAVRESLEPTTVAAYEQHVRLHIVPFLGQRKLNHLTKPTIEAFRDELLDGGRSRAMAGRVLRSLAALIGDAERKGYVAQNVARGVRLRRSKREAPNAIIPGKAELRALIDAAAYAGSRDHAMMLVLIFAGLRASELRGLPWRSIDLKARTITIAQRADCCNVIGAPKSASGRRTIPIPDQLVKALRRWRLQCVPSHLDLVFPSAAGTPQFHPNLVLNFLEPVQIAAGVTEALLRAGKSVVDDVGRPVLVGRYTLHSFRHAAASLWIEQRISPKRVQSWMGHHSIQVTFDTYGHLFAALEDDVAMVTSAAAKLLESGDAAAAAV